MKNFETLSRVEQHAFPGAQSTYNEPPNIPNSELVWMTARDNDGDWITGTYVPGNQGICVIHFYGNHENLRASEYVIERLRERGVSILMFDYRGYGASNGRPRDSAFYNDAEMIYDWLRERYPHERIVVSGWFVGSAVAIHLAQTRAVEGALLFSPPTNMMDIVSHLFPKDEIIIEEGMPFRFDNLERIRKLRCPIMLVHGNRNEVVPRNMIQQLEAAIRTPYTRVDIADAGHQDLFATGGDRLWQSIYEFLDQLRATDEN